MIDRLRLPFVATRVAVLARWLTAHLSRRDPRLWAFGNVKGYRDNPRYLAEHVARSHPAIRVWWIARGQQEAASARAAGLNVVLAGRPGARILRRAGVAFLSNGFQDLDASSLGGAFVVDLRHGQGTKRILLESIEDPAQGTSPLGRARRWIRRRYVGLRLAQVDMIVAPGEQEKAMYVRAFGGSPSRILVLGSPRFDILLARDPVARAETDRIRDRLGVDAGDYLVVWLPTWRDDGDMTWLLPLDSRRLEQFLGDTRAVIVLKPHPYSDSQAFRDRLPIGERLRFLPDSDEDVNQLLRAADALVTDYSSAAYDFALLDRPIRFFAPDLAAQLRRRRLLPSFERLILARNHDTWDTLLAELHELAVRAGDVGDATAAEIRTMSRNMDQPGSCERITTAVATAVDVSLGGAT